MQGLLSDLDHKNTESIAYRFGQGRMGLQWFMGVVKTDYYLSNASLEVTEAEFARLYHWKQHNRLAPLNINKRQI